jgi:hypothetical protein
MMELLVDRRRRRKIEYGRVRDNVFGSLLDRESQCLVFRLGNSCQSQRREGV